MDRAELAGTGAAIAFHVALIAALSLSLAHVARPPEPPAMEIELVDEVGLQRAAPSVVPASATSSQAPEQAQQLAPPPPLPPTTAPEGAEEPQPTPVPQPPTPAARPMPAPVGPAPPQAAPARTTPAKPFVSRIGADFLKGIPDPPSSGPPRPAAARFDVAAKASVSDAIRRQIQPCANDQPFVGEGANRITLLLNLRLDRSGRLQGSPSVVSVSGVDEDNGRYVDVVKDQARRVYAQCSPLRLPADLYSTPDGGWSNINIRYRVK